MPAQLGVAKLVNMVLKITDQLHTLHFYKGGARILNLPLLGGSGSMLLQEYFIF